MELNSKNLRIVLNHELKDKLVKSHIDSVNVFYKIGINQIMTDTFEIKSSINNTRDATPEDQKIDKITVEVDITNITLKKPEYHMYKSGRLVELTPKDARLNDLTYSSPLKINAKITAVAYNKDGSTNEKVDYIKDLRISGIPTMVRSELCNTHGKGRSALKALGEDPTDNGGYFIIKGIEWIIDNLESVQFNSLHAYRNIGHKNEIARGEFISKPGDNFENSTQIKLLRLTDGRLVCHMVVQRMHDYDGHEMEIPFYVIFRALGITSDREMIQHIILSDENEGADAMKDILEKAMRVKYDKLEGAKDIYNQMDMIIYLGRLMDTFKQHYGPDKVLLGDEETRENKQKYIVNTLLDMFDKFFLPHIGMGMDRRRNKLRYFGYLINKLLQVELQMIKSSDRDSYAGKRINRSGDSLGKIFKKQFNFAVVQAIKAHIRRETRDTQFNNINWANTIRSAINGTDFEKALINAITTSADTKAPTPGKSFSSHLSSQQLHRKNPLNVLSTLRQITSPNTSSSKASDRADEMRRVHSSYNGYICPVQSADTGDKVGMQKQTTISSSITSAGHSIIIKEHILNNPLCHKLDDVSPNDIFTHDMAKIFVNGDWIALTTKPIQLVTQYRKLRRTNGIDKYTTIYHDLSTDDIHLWIDVGRIIRPLLIVYNDNKKKFKQWITLTKDHLKKLYTDKITIGDLITEGIVEYINPEEHQNCLIAQTYETLMENQNNELLQFTHCEIPQAVAGLPCLTSPYAQHNQVARVCFQTNQVKQTCAWFALNWQFRADKDVFLQYHNENPLVKTMANNYMNPSGSNVMVAIMFYGGYNQEDSLIFNKSAIKRGLYTGTYFNFERTELERNEEFATSNAADTDDIKSANYEKIQNGLIAKGTIIENGDVIIGKRVQLLNDDSEYAYSDRSIVYKGSEPAVIVNVINERNQADNEICKVIYRSVRPVTIGDKFCLTGDHDVLTTDGWINIKNITTNHTVATMNPDTDELYYTKPLNTYKFDNNEELIYIQNQFMETKCTKNHKLYAKVDGKFGLHEAQTLLNKKFHIKRNAINKNPDIQNFALPKLTHTQKYRSKDVRDLPMNEWLEFLGIYIAEGCVDLSKSTRIYVHKSRVRNKLDSILPILGLINKDYGDNCYYITDLQLSSYLSLLNKSTEKYLPEFVWSLSANQSKILLNALMLGDGSGKKNRKLTEYYTQSSQLADDIQRLTLQCNGSCRMTIKNKKGEVVKIKGNTTTRSTDLFRLTISYQDQYLVGHHKKTTFTTISDNYVYCLEMPQTHIFYVRLNGKPHWTGNSSRAGQWLATGGCLGCCREYNQGKTLESLLGTPPNITV